MEESIFPEYLKHPTQVKKAVDLLDHKCEELDVLKLFLAFNDELKIKSGEGFPITRAYLGGQFCRARINDEPKEFVEAEKVSQIGPRLDDIGQGRANPNGIPVFYAANSKDTACFEVLQEREAGIYKVTIGCWKSSRELCLANLSDGSDPDFSELPFTHSMPNEYVKEWPNNEGKSTMILNNYFREKFKMFRHPGLYNITNVIAEMYFSLVEVDGIGYPSVSNRYKGYNLALKDYSMLTCETVEEWHVNKISNDILEHQLLRKGTINADGNITWDL